MSDNENMQTNEGLTHADALEVIIADALEAAHNEERPRAADFASAVLLTFNALTTDETTFVRTMLLDALGVSEERVDIAMEGGLLIIQ